MEEMKESLCRGGGEDHAGRDLDRILGDSGKGIGIDAEIEKNFLRGHGAPAEICEMHRGLLRRHLKGNRGLLGLGWLGILLLHGTTDRLCGRCWQMKSMSTMDEIAI